MYVIETVAVLGLDEEKALPPGTGTVLTHIIGPVLTRVRMMTVCCELQKQQNTGLCLIQVCRVLVAVDIHATLVGQCVAPVFRKLVAHYHRP